MNSYSTIVATLLLLSGGAAHAAMDLVEVFDLARHSDPQRQAAEQQRLASLEVRPQSNALYLPNLSLSGEVKKVDSEVKRGLGSDADYDSKGYTLSLQQPIFRMAAIEQMRQADALVAKAEADFAAIDQGLALRVAEAYFNLLAAQDTLRFAEAEIRFITQQLHQAKQRFEVGLSAITDVQEAQAGYDSALAREIVARNAVDNGVEALRELTGIEHRRVAVLVAEIPLLPPEPADIEAWVEQALQHNLPLLAATAAAHSAEQEYKRRQAGHYPTLDLVASYGYSDTYEDPTFGSERSDKVVGLQLSVPLYEGGATSSKAREGRYLFNQAQQQLDQQRRAAIRQTREAYLRVTAGISLVQASKQALASTETSLEATQAGFEVGTRTAIDVLNAQSDRFSVRRDYARSRYNYLLATLQLKQAVGSLGEQDIRDLNRWLN